MHPVEKTFSLRSSEVLQASSLPGNPGRTTFTMKRANTTPVLVDKLPTTPLGSLSM